MLKGHLDMIVLAALAAGPAHGYAVIEEIRRKSRQAFDLPEGTIYPALHRLEQAGLLASRWVIVMLCCFGVLAGALSLMRTAPRKGRGEPAVEL